MKHLFEVNYRVIGQENQTKISNTKIAVIGVGGLGCSVAHGLVQMGVKHLTLIDSDTVELSNLPRQILFTEKDIGKFKASIAKEKLIPHINKPKIKAFTENFTSKKGSLLIPDADIVVDCTDNYISRFAISHIASELNIPMVYGGVNQFEGQVGVFNYKGSRPFHKVFPNIEHLVEQENCSASGVLPFVVQIIGSLQVAEVFKLITNHKNVLNNKLLCFHTLTGKQRILSLKKV